jgi:hypothetical protein
MNNLHPIAQAVQSQGRGDDSQLIHMTPGEIQGLQAIAMAHGGALSINPTTGLPEAGFLSKLLPAIAGFALGPAGFGVMSSLGAGLTVGGLTALTSGDLGKGLSAGIGAWGGSELGGAVSGMGSGAIGGQAAANATSQAALQNKAGAGAVANAARDAAVKEATRGQILREGAKSAMSDPSRLIDSLGGVGKTAAIANAIGTPFAVETATSMPEMSEQKSKPVSVSQMEYRDNYRGPEKGEARSSGERNWYDGEYVKTGEKVYGAAQGGIMGFSGDEGSLVNPTFVETVTQMPGDDPIVKKRPTPAVGKLGFSDDLTDENGYKYRLKYDPATGKYTRDYGDTGNVPPTEEEEDEAPQKAPTPIVNQDPGGNSDSTPMTDEQFDAQQMQGQINANTLADVFGWGDIEDFGGDGDGGSSDGVPTYGGEVGESVSGPADGHLGADSNAGDGGQGSGEVGYDAGDMGHGDASAPDFGGGYDAGDGGYGSGSGGYDAGDMGQGDASAPGAGESVSGTADSHGGVAPGPAAGGGDGGDGGKIICTAMNEAYGFGSFRNAIWIKYSDKHLTKAHEVGYHTLFLPLVDFGFKRGDGKLNLVVRKVLEWGTRHRSTDLRAELHNKKRDTTGRIIRLIFEPLCYAVGKIKGY